MFFVNSKLTFVLKFYEPSHYLPYGEVNVTLSDTSGSETPTAFSADTRNMYSALSFSLSTSYEVTSAGTLLTFDQEDLEVSLASKMYSLTFEPPSSAGGCQVTVTEVRLMLENSIGPIGGDGAAVTENID